jgi:phosphoribosylanthranilate isomerase
VIVIPAIDLRGGRCVRLLRGDHDAETVVAEDPLEVGRRFEGAGAPWLHVVDLDAAAGSGSNRGLVRELCRRVGTPVQLGGGLRSIEAVERALRDGAERAILGTAAALEPELVAEAVRRFGDRVVVALDVLDGRLRTHGWREPGPPLDAALQRLEAVGPARYLVTSIARDGAMEGPDLDLYRRMVRLTVRPLIASGGVRTADDVRALSEVRLEAVVVGRALYVGTLDLTEVVRG